MKSVLISIRPWWCLLIAQGKKTIEVRKTIPKLKPPFKVYIYCTNTKPFLVWGDVFRGNWDTEFTNVSGYSRERAEKIWDLFNGKVMGEFVCDEITYFGNVATDPWERLLGSTHEEHKRLITEKACLSESEMLQYKGHYGWHISKLQVYDDPKPITDFYKCGALSMEDLDEELCCHCSQTDYGDKKEIHTPSGVWMCEGAWCADAYQAYLDEEFSITRPPQSWCYVEEGGYESR